MLRYKPFFVSFFMAFLLLSLSLEAKKDFFSFVETENVDLVPAPSIAPGDVLLHELLFNPYGQYPDFVEIINVSDKYISLQQLFIATRKTDGSVAVQNRISTYPTGLEPGDILLLCENPDTLSFIYPQACTVNFWTCEIPRLNNDAGCVLLLNAEGVIIDELNYTEQMHHASLRSKDGVSLERVSTAKPTQELSNWQSASFESDYATPGCANSVSSTQNTLLPEVQYSSSAVSPNADGYQDELLVQFNLPLNAWQLNLRVFNANGVLIDLPIKNELITGQSEVQWNGKKASGENLPMGMYVLHFDLWELGGARKQFKYACAVVSN